MKTHGLCRKDKNLPSNDGEGNVLFASISHNYLCKQGESWTKLIESGLWINKLIKSINESCQKIGGEMNIKVGTMIDYERVYDPAIMYIYHCSYTYVHHHRQL